MWCCIKRVHSMIGIAGCGSMKECFVMFVVWSLSSRIPSTQIMRLHVLGETSVTVKVFMIKHTRNNLRAGLCSSINGTSLFRLIVRIHQSSGLKDVLLKSNGSHTDIRGLRKHENSTIEPTRRFSSNCCDKYVCRDYVCQSSVRTIARVDKSFHT